MKKNFYFLKDSAKLLAIVALCVGYTEAEAQGFVYPSNDADINISDDGNGYYSKSTMIVNGIPEDHHIYYVAVGTKIEHTYVGDLVMALEMPNTQSIGLMHRPGSTAVVGNPLGNNADLSADNLVVFTDYSVTSSELMGDGMNGGEVIAAGNFLSSWNNDEIQLQFSSFKDLAKNYTGLKNGDWEVYIKDVTLGDSGSLNFVDMLINYDRYCVPFFANNYEYISNVNFAGLNYESGRFGYGHPDYHTAALGHGSTPVTQGQTYPISVTISPDSGEYIYTFADWNQDGDFDDADETYTVASNVNTAGPHTVDIAVPVDAMIGETRMRVFLGFDQSFIDPCYLPNGGEVEDFTLMVEASMGVNDLMANDKTTAYPNPIIDEVNFTSKNTISQINIYNVNGQEVMMQNANSQSLKLNVSNLPSGVYVAKIKTDKGTETIKLIKK